MRGGLRQAVLRIAACAAVAALAGSGRAQDREPGPVLKAMQAELERARELRLSDLAAPYFVEFALEDVRSFSVSAALGGVISRQHSYFRVPRVQVRVGSPEFDQTNYALTDLFRGGGMGRVPLDDDVPGLRTFFWLAADSAYKGAVEALARKKAALRNVSQGEVLPDFWAAPAARLFRQVDASAPREEEWTARVRALSALFAGYPAVTHSRIDYEDTRSTAYLANSEGTLVQMPENLGYLRARAYGQAPDGMMVRDASTIQWLETAAPAEAEFRRAAETAAANVTALAAAPAAENYLGPVLFEGIAAGQLFAQLLGRDLAVPRRPVPEPGRTPPFQPSDLESRLGARILPEWMDVVDDPAQTEWRGRPLFGHYELDMEGVAPKPLVMVEKGVLRNFLLTRQPVRGQTGSNGRARLPGAFGANAASFSNLFVSAGQRVTPAALRKQLMELCAGRNLSFGLVVRKLDFPSSAEPEELRRIAAGARQRGAGGKLLSPPLLVYRAYPDGREELVRGLSFRALPVRSLRDIVAASDESSLFDFLGNSAPLSLTGAGGFVTANAVVAPSVLFDEMELERDSEDPPRLPVVPPPALAAAR